MNQALKLLILLLWCGSAYSQVDPPNYNFSVDKFKIFMPGSELSQIQKVYGQGEITSKKSPYITYKFYVDHLRYKFIVLVQTQDKKVSDFHARLPHYFLHDVFLQSLYNRIGPQDKYKKTEESAVYIWNNKEGNKHVYSGACTITCFPIFYSVYPSQSEKIINYKPIIKSLL